jgi:hypothetical protein
VYERKCQIGKASEVSEAQYVWASRITANRCAARAPRATSLRTGNRPPGRPLLNFDALSLVRR